MQILSSTTDKVELIGTDATTDLDYVSQWVEMETSDGSVKQSDTKVGNITDSTVVTDISGSPGASTKRWAFTTSIRNKHSTDSNTVTVRYVKAGGTARELIKVTLFPGWELKLSAEGVWFVYDSDGGVVMGAADASDTVQGLIRIATVAEMEGASAVDLAVTPGRLHRHPAAAKFWAQVTGGGTPSLTTNFGVSSLTDTGVGRLTLTFSTAFSSANWCCMATTFTTTTTGDEGIANIDAKAAGTVEVGNRIVTPAFADPNVGYDVCGFGDQ